MNSLRQAVRKHPMYSRLGGGVLLLIFGAGYLLNPVVQIDNLRTLLSVMIAAQASVLAIVVSVTLISTQLVATRYAPRMAILPFRTQLFKGAFRLFAVSIIVDVFLLVGVTTTTTPLYSGVFFVAVGLFFSVLLFLYSFVRGMVAHTSPENLVTLFIETISADEYLTRSEELADAPEENAHPLQPLYRFIMSALSRNEHGTARAALDQYQQYASRIMDELDDNGVFDNDSLDCGDELFGPVLTEHLHSITIHAAEKGESQILASAVDAQVALGKQGMTIGRWITVPGQALRGLRRTTIEAPVNEEDHVTFNCTWPAVAELMLEETNYEQDRVLLSGKKLISGRLVSSLHQSNKPRWHTDALRRFFDDLCEAHTTVLKHIDDGPGFDGIDLDKDPCMHEMPASVRMRQARFSRDAIFDATSTFLQFRIDEDFWPATTGNFRTDWKDLCIAAASNSPDDHAIHLCQALVEMAFMENLHRPYEQPTSRLFGVEQDEEQDTDYLYWVGELVSILEETSSPVVEQAFDNILQYDYEEGPTPVRVVRENEEVEEQYYFPNLSLQEFRALNTYSQFPGLLEELRKRSLQE